MTTRAPHARPLLSALIFTFWDAQCTPAAPWLVLVAVPAALACKLLGERVSAIVAASTTARVALQPLFFGVPIPGLAGMLDL